MLALLAVPATTSTRIAEMPLPDVPNVILPLATSYNERGVAGFTHSVTNAEDQRKVNCIYEPVKNALTGKGTLTLAKRSGVTIDADTYGASTQNSNLMIAQFGGGVQSKPLLFSIAANGDFTGATQLGTAVILASGHGRVPCFVDKTLISSVENIVVQLRDPNPDFVVPIVDVTQRVFFSTDNVTWTEITDNDFDTGIAHKGKMENLDGYALILDRNNLIWNSDLNSIANWTATSFIAKQIRQDFAVGLARLKNQILAFGDETVEAFYNAGGTTGSPLGRLAHLHQKIGLVDTVANGGAHYYATVGSRIYFVGRRAGGQYSLGVFSFDGSSFEKVSSVYIDKLLSEKAASIYSVNAVGHHGQSGVAICWTAPGAATQQSIIFYPDWKEWFEWSSTIFSPTNSGAWFLGSSSGNRHRVYNFLSTDNWQDAGTSYQWLTQFRLPTNGASRNVMNMYGVDADTDTSANDLTVEISRDDCATFSTLGTIDMTQDRKVLFRGGAFRKAHIRIGNTNARPSRIHNFLARING